MRDSKRVVSEVDARAFKGRAGLSVIAGRVVDCAELERERAWAVARFLAGGTGSELLS